MFLTRSLNRKLLAAFLLLGLLPLLIFSTISANRSSQSMEEQIFSQLEAVRTIKNSQINQYFNEREADLRLLAKMTNIIFEDAKQKLKVIHAEQVQLLQGDATLPSSSDKAHATVFLISPEGQLLWGSEKTSTEITSLKDLPYVQEALSNKTGVGLRIGLKGKLALLHWSPIKRNGQVHAVVTELDLNQAFQLTPASGQANFFTDYIHQYGYYDLFLINNDGYVFHTVSQEADYQTNLRNGPFQNSNLARIFKQATQSNDYALADFEPYAPSNDEPASFIAIPLPASGNASEIVVALQLSIDSINRVMQERAGMGDSGETYLVGPDYRMRSDSYLDPADRTVSASFAGSISQNGADTEASRSAIAGKSGVDIIQDYNGNPVLSAYAPVDINDGSLRWAIIAELDQSEAFAPVYKQVQLAITLTLIAAVVIIVAGTLLARSISQPIVTIAKHASYIAHGDLTHTIAITQHDEVGELQQSMHSMNQTLRDTVTHISQSAAQQSAASEQLAAITEETRRNVDIQHHSTDQVASAINQMAATVQEVSRNTQSAADAAYKSQSLVQDGGQVVTQTTEGIHHLAEELDNSSQLIKELEQKANNIGSILDVIKGIAEQTNLLALNAAIEAARAGEQGRGFAVVADEVRSLAQSTQQSASEIEVMIQELQNGSNRSVEAMNRGHKKTEEIVQQASQLTTALDDIQQSVSAISDMNTQIASAAEQQSSVANDINENAVAISNKSEETGQSAQQIAIASEELSRLANELHEQIAQFKLS